MGGIANDIKASLTAVEVAQHYGFTPNRSGFIQCPFHQDDTASLKLYNGRKGWHCFGCGAGSTVIDFVMQLFGLSFRDACLKINEDFSLGLTSRRIGRKEMECQVRKRLYQQAEKERRRQELLDLCEQHRIYWDALKFCPEPTLGPDGCINFHPLYAEALRRLPDLEYRIQELMDGGDSGWS